MRGFRGKIKTKITIQDAVDMFINDRISMGLVPKTIQSYRNQLSAFSKHMDFSNQVDQMTENQAREAIISMSEGDLSRNTVQSYVRSFRVFLRWCREQGITDVDVKPYKGEETTPVTYTEEELEKLLKKPNMQGCLFTEYRTWTIINLLVDNGIRASSIRSIQNRDVSLDASVIWLRHTKNKKSQAIPLSKRMVAILKEYTKIRAGRPDDYLFPNAEGYQLTEHALRHAIRNYNLRRGVQKTSIHAFRHTFARMYLVDCEGNALKLQKLLGHSTLKMTQHYVKLYDQDLVQDYQDRSPLSKFSRQKIQMPGQKK